ncbi:efflux RND transporter periplasmic adaptor subunit [Aeoliella sp. ICT_H6.2]|uniref:Efflux RND transporter periplasmic adaptor subunit n=1 Tax=Aeoliella straminimaris TaxID=2954799 RepID=A0A9X2JHX7_9BACT|nr:efflux RND transporter periplasmic adaptor subunit [Aeoliella straminimaris]MCO6046510.1 efflux RND transporter periplasmic adaptor subunit [Aeoliella straminimaris]
MSQDPSQLDLSQLAVDRTPATPSRPRVRRAWLTRYVLPVAILCGFAALFGWATRDSFLPAQPVTITPVVVSRAEVKQEGTPLFQAAGWVEPRPTPVLASSLAPGVIEELLVVEGDLVKKGQPVATLIDADARIALAEAKSLHALQKAELRRAEAILAAAKTNLEQPVVLQATLADSEALLAELERELNNLPYAIEAAKTKRELAEVNVRRKEQAGDAILGRILREARADLATAENTLQELIAREPTLKQQQQSLRQKRDAVAAQLQLLTEEKRALAEAEANLSIVEARVDQARLAVDTAELRLERMTVRAPINGCVLSLEARPGQWLSGVGASAPAGASAVVGLYDPKSLQVRVDVRLEDVPQVLIDQPTQIETAALAGPIAGRVISVTTQADIQKNTLQVKVAVLDPPAVIKPEMLAKVTFLAPPSPAVEGQEAKRPLRLFVPRTLVTSADGGDTVWIADLTAGVAIRRPIEVGRGVAEGGLVEVLSGLSPTDKLIVGGRESLSEGERVRVAGEERDAAGSMRSFPVSIESAQRTAQLADKAS